MNSFEYADISRKPPSSHCVLVDVKTKERAVGDTA